VGQRALIEEMTPNMTTHAKFDVLLKLWRDSQDKVDEIDSKQAKICGYINDTFSTIVKEQQLLAELPWEVEVYPGSSNLSCRIKDTKVQEFLDKMVWKGDSRYSYLYNLKLCGKYIHLDDGIMEINFDDEDEMMNFCDEHGIKPGVTRLNDQRNDAIHKVKRLDQIIKRLS